MHFMSLNKFSDFMQVQSSIRKHPTKNKHFPMHNLFSTIYLLHEQNLNPNTYFEQEINMSNCIQATDNDVHMYAKFGYFTLYVFL
jgi:hypothetical protein